MNTAIAITGGGRLPTFEEIVELEQLMLQCGERVDVKTRHLFAPGIYAREITIPPGVAVIGKLHKTEHISIVSKGRILVVSTTSKAVIEAPHSFVAPAGMKRYGLALTETVWTTFHPTTSRDLAEIEDQFIAKSADELVEFARKEALCPG